MGVDKMLVNNVCNDLNFKDINSKKTLIHKIENLRKELDNKLVDGIDNDEEILELSRKLDELIVEYFNIKYKN